VNRTVRSFDNDDDHDDDDVAMYRVCQKSNPLGKFSISGIGADFYSQFTAFTDDDSGQISCRFY